jgi:hypothetical protein
MERRATNVAVVASSQVHGRAGIRGDGSYLHVSMQRREIHFPGLYPACGEWCRNNCQSLYDVCQIVFRHRKDRRA